jgi:hypothetical protein
MVFNGAAPRILGIMATSPGRFSGSDNGWSLGYATTIVNNLSESLKKFPNIPTIPSGAAIGWDLIDFVLSDLAAPLRMLHPRRARSSKRVSRIRQSANRRLRAPPSRPATYAGRKSCADTFAPRRVCVCTYGLQKNKPASRLAHQRSGSTLSGIARYDALFSSPWYEGSRRAMPGSADLMDAMANFFPKPDYYPADGRGALNFVIVGGGPTGTELVGALADMIRGTLPEECADLAVKHAQVYLVDHGNALLAAFSEQCRDAERQLVWTLTHKRTRRLHRRGIPARSVLGHGHRRTNCVRRSLHEDDRTLDLRVRVRAVGRGFPCDLASPRHRCIRPRGSRVFRDRCEIKGRPPGMIYTVGTLVAAAMLMAAVGGRGAKTHV